jgi:hypothetical protein
MTEQYDDIVAEANETARRRAPIFKLSKAIMRAVAAVDRKRGGKGVVTLGLVEAALHFFANGAAAVAQDGADADAVARDLAKAIAEYAAEGLD